MTRRPEGKRSASRRPTGAIRDRASAQAALALVESLMLTLIDRRLLTVDNAVETVEIAIDAKRSAVQEGDTDATVNVAAGLLSDVANSVRAARPPALKPLKGRKTLQEG